MFYCIIPNTWSVHLIGLPAAPMACIAVIINLLRLRI